MAEQGYPPWWTDIERCRNNALTELQSVLDALESALSHNGDFSSRSIQKNIVRWSELVQVSTSAAGNLRNCVRLAESRRQDAARNGMNAPESPDLDAAIARVSRRLNALVSKTGEQMTVLTGELGRLQPRRPRLRHFRDNSPSHLDVHV